METGIKVAPADEEDLAAILRILSDSYLASRLRFQALRLSRTSTTGTLLPTKTSQVYDTVVRKIERRGGVMKAVIWRGESTRLRPLTCKQPKPMVPLMDRPVMEYIVELLKIMVLPR